MFVPTSAFKLSLCWAFISLSRALKNIVLFQSNFLEKNLLSIFFFFPPGTKDALTEKPIIPPEPAEPVLCGSMAIGAVSLAVAKTNAMLDNNPLYFNIALLKHQQVRSHRVPLQGLMSISIEMNHVSRSSFDFSPISGTANEAHYPFADGVSGQLWEVITWEAEFNERSDLYTSSWINS